MSLRRCGAILVALLILALATPVVAADSVHLVPRMFARTSGSPDFAALPRTFFMNTADLDFTGGRVFLSSTTDGKGRLRADDGLQLAVVRPDGTALWYHHDYMDRTIEEISQTPPIEITRLLQPGRNRVQVRLVDTFGTRFGANDYYLVTLGEGDAAADAVAAETYAPIAEAFVYAETPTFTASPPMPVELCIVNPGGAQEATAGVEVKGLVARSLAPITARLEPGFNRVVIPFEAPQAGTYVVSGTIKVGPQTLTIAPTSLTKVAPSLGPDRAPAIMADLTARLRDDQARIRAGQEVRAAAADALATRALMESVTTRVSRSAEPGLIPGVRTRWRGPRPPKPEVAARAALIRASTQVLQRDAALQAIVDQLQVLQGNYLDWGRLRYAKMAGAPGRTRYDYSIGQSGDKDGVFHMLAIYWANLPIASVRRFVYTHRQKVEAAPKSFTLPDRKSVVVAGNPGTMFWDPNGEALLMVGNARCSLEVYAPTPEAATRLAELSFAEQPVTPQIADEFLSYLKPPVKVSGVGTLLAWSANRAWRTGLAESATRVDEGSYIEAMETFVRGSLGALLSADDRQALYTLTGGRPKTMPAAAAGPAITCWAEGDAQYLRLSYDSPGSRTEVTATLRAIIHLLPGHQVLVGDTHQHSTCSDGAGYPEETFFNSLSHFMDFHALTDHNEIVGAQAVAKALPSWGVSYPFCVGEEVSTEDAHIVALEPDGLIDWRGDPDVVLQRIRDSGAAVILAHPWATPWQTATFTKTWRVPGVDAYEPNPYDPTTFWHQWIKTGPLPPMVGSTDSHSLSYFRPFRAMVFVKEATPAGIKQAIKEGKCCAWTPAGPLGPDAVMRAAWALVSDREYYEQLQLERLAKRALELK